MNECRSDDSKDIATLSYEERKALRKGQIESNKIFEKGRSEKLKVKK